MPMQPNAYVQKKVIETAVGLCRPTPTHKKRGGGAETVLAILMGVQKVSTL